MHRRLEATQLCAGGAGRDRSLRARGWLELMVSLERGGLSGMLDEQRREDFYQALRARIAEWLAGKGKGFRHAQILLLAPDLFHLLTRLLLDRRIPVAEKAGLGAAL